MVVPLQSLLSLIVVSIHNVGAQIQCTAHDQNMSIAVKSSMLGYSNASQTAYFIGGLNATNARVNDVFKWDMQSPSSWFVSLPVPAPTVMSSNGLQIVADINDVIYVVSPRTLRNAVGTGGSAIYPFDSATEEWLAPIPFTTPLGNSLITPCVTQNDSHIIVFDGRDWYRDNNPIYILFYDVSQDLWTTHTVDAPFAVTGNVSIGWHSTYCSYAQGSLYIFGGEYNPPSNASSVYLDGIYKYDIASRVFVSLGTLPTSQANGIAVYDGFDYIYLVGALLSDGVPSDAIRIFDLSTEELLSETLTAVFRFAKGVSMIFDGHLWIFGGQDESASQRTEIVQKCDISSFTTTNPTTATPTTATPTTATPTSATPTTAAPTTATPTSATPTTATATPTTATPTTATPTSATPTSAAPTAATPTTTTPTAATPTSATPTTATPTNATPTTATPTTATLTTATPTSATPTSATPTTATPTTATPTSATPTTASPTTSSPAPENPTPTNANTATTRTTANATASNPATANLSSSANLTSTASPPTVNLTTWPLYPSTTEYGVNITVHFPTVLTGNETQKVIVVVYNYAVDKTANTTNCSEFIETDSFHLEVEVETVIKVIIITCSESAENLLLVSVNATDLLAPIANIPDFDAKPTITVVRRIPADVIPNNNDVWDWLMAYYWIVIAGVLICVLICLLPLCCAVYRRLILWLFKSAKNGDHAGNSDGKQQTKDLDSLPKRVTATSHQRTRSRPTVEYQTATAAPETAHFSIEMARVCDVVEQNNAVAAPVIHNPLVLLVGISEYDGKPYDSLPGVVVDMGNHRKLWEDVYNYRVLPDKHDKKWFGKRHWTFYEIEEFFHEMRHALVDVDEKLVHDALIVVINGHGVLDGVIPSDFDEKDPDNNDPVSFSGLKHSVGAFWKKGVALSIPRIFIIDACRGGQRSGRVSTVDRGVHQDHLCCMMFGNSPGIRVKETVDGGEFTNCLVSEFSKARHGQMTLSSIAGATSRALKEKTNKDQQCWLAGDSECYGIVLNMHKH